MKRTLLWIIAMILGVSGMLLVAAALVERGPNLDYDVRIVQAQDPKLRQILREEQHQEEMDLLKTRVGYISIAAVEFAVAAFLVGRARRRSS